MWFCSSDMLRFVGRGGGGGERSGGGGKDKRQDRETLPYITSLYYLVGQSRV